ncbi:MAG: hypothetical protein QXS54_07640 [Candidatus Methanomethylicaceae archaeon]
MLDYTAIVLDKTVKSGDSISIALLSDLHVDSAKFNEQGLAAALDGVDYMMIFGDLADWIFHSDPRYLPENDAAPSGDAFVTKRIKRVASVLRSLPPKTIFISYGNHETAVVKHFGVDPIEEIAALLGCHSGKFAGTVDVIAQTVGGRMARCRIGYHHGRWGGHSDKGYSGAKRFFDAFEGYDVLAYGHNHASRCDVVSKVSLSGSRYVPRNIIMVNCSSQVQAISGGSVASYESVHGHALSPNVVNVLHLTAKCLSGNWYFRKSLEIRV